MNCQLAPLLPLRSSELALDNAATASGVAQLTGHLTAATFDINIVTADQCSYAIYSAITQPVGCSIGDCISSWH